MHRLTLLLALQACFVTDAELQDALDRDRDGFQPDIAGGPDCGPEDPAIHPDAVEVCGDGIDNDCDGVVDDRGAGEREWFADTDGDGWGDGSPVMACNAPDNHVLQAGDCDDDNAEVSPGVLDLCDGQDQDCDGLVDDDATFRLTFRDADGDGFGTPDDTLETCGANPGYVAESGDCDDTDPSIGPTQLDGCDGIDTNCNGSIDDDADFALHYPDDDGDGFGRTDEPLFACGTPSGYATEPGDCVDTDPGIAPGETDSCDEADNDCDGLVDEDATATLYFEDADGDGVGRSDVSISTCQPSPFGYVTVAGDCDDTDPAVIVPSWYLDGDGDGHGTGSPVQACTAPADHVALGDDCDDSTDLRAPSLSEVCNNGIDDDCSSATSCRLVGPVEVGIGLQFPQDDLSVSAAYFTDGDFDLFVDTGDGDCMVFSEAQTPIPASPDATLPNRCGTEIDDLSGDGLPERAIGNSGAGTLDVYFSGGTGSLMPAIQVTGIGPTDQFGIAVAAVTLPTLGNGLLIGTEGNTGDAGSIHFIPDPLGSLEVATAATATVMGNPGDQIGRSLLASDDGTVTIGSTLGSWFLNPEELEGALLSGALGPVDLVTNGTIFDGATIIEFDGSPSLLTVSQGTVPLQLTTLLFPGTDPTETPLLDLTAPAGSVYIPIGDLDFDGRPDATLQELDSNSIVAIEVLYGASPSEPSDSLVLYRDLAEGRIYDFTASVPSQPGLDLDDDGYGDLILVSRRTDGTGSELHYVYGTGQ